MILPNGAIVAVVDGEKLVLFKNTGHDTMKLSALETPLIPDKASGSTGHSSSAANPDDDTQAEDGFAVGVAGILNQRALSGELNDLLVIAAPKTLGELRKHWHKALEAKLIGEIAKDLTGHPTDEITAAIEKA
jgi:protein required for attachment to host cells